MTSSDSIFRLWEISREEDIHTLLNPLQPSALRRCPPPISAGAAPAPDAGNAKLRRRQCELNQCPHLSPGRAPPAFSWVASTGYSLPNFLLNVGFESCFHGIKFSIILSVCSFSSEHSNINLNFSHLIFILFFCFQTLMLVFSHGSPDAIDFSSNHLYSSIVRVVQGIQGSIVQK